MALTAIVSLFIHRRMLDSPILGMSPTHLFVPFVLFASWRGLDGAVKGRITHDVFFGP